MPKFGESTQTQTTACWCGNTQHFAPFSPEYVRCLKCDTLVSTRRLSDKALRVENDDEDFYGKAYWFGHQTEDLGYPPIDERARQDLSDRCLHWLKTLLKYKLPPAKTLELGAAHGAFVGLLRLAGFDATGLELSPWVVQYASSTFGVPMLQGRVEEQALEPGSFDVIVLIDVLEHLPDPMGTMGHCLKLLKPDGILLIQMPEYRGQEYAEMLATNDPFLSQLSMYNEHVYLYSEKATQLLFERLGAPEIVFEPPIFKELVMFFVVARVPMHPLESIASENALKQTLTGRAVLALLDLYQRQQEIVGALQRAADERLEVIHEQSNRITILQQAADERLALIESLHEKLKMADQAGLS